MKLKNLLTLLAAFALTVPAFAADDDTPLGKEMDKLNKALKAISRNGADPAQKDANLAKVAEAKAANAAGMKYEPAKTKDVPAGEKAKFLSDYKAAMEEAGKTLDELQAAITAGKTDEAKSLLDKLNTEKKAGHKKFKAD